MADSLKIQLGTAEIVTTPLLVGNNVSTDSANYSLRLADFLNNKAGAQYIEFGHDAGVNNCAELVFNYSASGSTSNLISLGFYGGALTNPIVLNGVVTVGGNLITNGTSTLSGAVSCSTTLAVTGISTLTGAVTCSTTLTSTGNFTASSTSTFTGAMTVNNNITGLAANSITGFGKVFNAIWNDYADYLHFNQGVWVAPGLAYIYDGGEVAVSSKYAQRGALGICTDTFGISTGLKKDVGGTQIPIAVSGFVLAHVDKIYPSGTPLTCGPKGILYKANLFTRIFHSERILATFFRVEFGEKWNDVSVDGRQWVQVK